MVVPLSFFITMTGDQVDGLPPMRAPVDAEAVGFAVVEATAVGLAEAVGVAVAAMALGARRAVAPRRAIEPARRALVLRIGNPLIDVT